MSRTWRLVTYKSFSSSLPAGAVIRFKMCEPVRKICPISVVPSLVGYNSVVWGSEVLRVRHRSLWPVQVRRPNLLERRGQPPLPKIQQPMQ